MSMEKVSLLADNVHMARQFKEASHTDLLESQKQSIA